MEINFIKKNIRISYKLLKFLYSNGFFYIISFYLLITTLASISELLSAYLISNYISFSLNNNLELTKFLNYFVLNPKLIIFIIINSACLRFISLFSLPRIATRISNRITDNAFNGFINSPIEFREKYSFEEIQTTFAVRPAQLTGGVIYSALNIINYFIILLIFIIFLLINQPLITASLIFSIIFFYLISAFSVREKLDGHSKIMNNFNQILTGLVDTSLRDPRFSIINFSQSKISEEYKNLDYKLRNSSTQITFLGSLPKVLIECLFFIGLLLFAILFIKTSNNTITNIPKLIILIACFQRLVPSIQGVYSNFLALKSNFPVLAFFLEFIDNKAHSKSNTYYTNLYKSKDLPETIIESSPIKYKFTKDITLSYPRFSILRGQFILIKGMSGKGKTTWIDLLIGLRKPSEGYIRRKFNTNKNIYLNADFFRDDILKIFSSQFYRSSKLISHDTFYNKTYNPELLEICGIDFLDSRNKFKSINLNGMSSGQFQRVQLFLSLSLNPEILILDEALNAIELEREHEIIRNLRKSFKNLTLIQISHRPYEEFIYDKIYNLN